MYLEKTMKDFNVEKFKPNTNYESELPWDDVIVFLNNRIVSSKFENQEPCPLCGLSSEKLVWVKFKSPAWTWKFRCGREGSLSICPKCNIQVELIPERMS